MNLEVNLASFVLNRIRSQVTIVPHLRWTLAPLARVTQLKGLKNKTQQ